MSTPSRNEPCPCGSGKKYKKCHGSVEVLDRLAQIQRDAPLMFTRGEAAEARRQSQQGLGKPIISAEVSGYRVIAVGNKLHYSKSWKTFHDFLLEYLKIVMGKEWWMAEVQKEAADRHPILQWALATAEHQNLLVNEPGRVNSAPMTGAAGALLHTSYDLYALDHHVSLHELLIKRLKNNSNFAGARYEVSVAAKLLRAGFELELEDETDGTSTHVEFTATYKRSGKKFSVEAKQREAGKIRIGRLLHRALSKSAAHARMVFIDINEPDMAQLAEPLNILVDVESRLLNYEHNASSVGLPAAYIIVTNSPWQHHPNDTGVRHSALFHGFRIPELQQGFAFGSIRQAVDHRSKHQEFADLMRSMQEHAEIPITFDGENPGFAYEKGVSRLVIGERYSVPDAAGARIDGTLESGIVLEQEHTAMCVLRLEDGRRVITRFALNESEMRAWLDHSETFFGVIDRNARRVVKKTVLDWYDFFHQTYRTTPKGKLVEWMTGPMQRDTLEGMEQSELARLYSEGLAATVWANEAQAAESRPSAQKQKRGKGARLNELQLNSPPPAGVN